MANTKIPVELSSTPGIVDNSNATAITIDSSENLIMTAGGTIRAGGANDLILDAGESGTPDIYLQSGGATKVKIEGSNGFVGIGTTSPSALLDVAYGDYQNSGALRIGADIGTNTSRTNSVRKIGALTVPHYTTAEDDIVVFLQDSDSGGSPLSIGGGSGFFNSPSLINFFTSTDGTTTGTERIRISSEGNLLINTTSKTSFPTNTGAAAFGIGGEVNLKLSSYGTAHTFQQFILAGSVVGSISATTSATSYNTSSDARLKDVTGEARGLEVINELNPVAYNWKADGKADEGLIAQEVLDIVPNAVSGSEEEMYQMDYSKLVVHLVAGMKEQQAQIEALQSEINLLKGE